MNEIYLDCAATMPVNPAVLQQMIQLYQADYANPSAYHRLGYEVEKKLNKSRERFAKILGVSAAEIFFTSGGTESNNLALLGTARANRRQGNHIIVSQIEHPSVLEASRQLEKEGFRVDYVAVDEQGRVQEEHLTKLLCAETILVSIMTVNNETGVIQDVAKLAARCKEICPQVYFHTDAVQAFGKIAMPALSQIDLLSVGGHKIGSPKGIGALYIKKGTKIEPILFGGKHQGGIRPGTENYPLVEMFTTVAEAVCSGREQNYQKAVWLREAFLQKMAGMGLDYQVNGDEQTSPYIINIGFADIRGEVLLHALEDAGIYVATGSACQSKKSRVSHVLEAMHAKYKEGSIRISFGYDLTQEQAEQASEQIGRCVTALRRFVRK